MNKHKCSNLHCSVCRGEMDVDRWAAEQIEKYGWYYHVVSDDPNPRLPTGFNAHTHGLPDKYDHRDFELVFPLLEQQRVVNSIFWCLVKRIADGEKFEPGDVSQIIKNYNIRLVLTPGLTPRQNCKVLRIILPDSQGKLDEDELCGIFAAQYQQGTLR